MDRTALEERIAHLERMVEDLSAELARQAALTDRLARRLQLLMEAEAEREAAAGETVPLADQRPPHW